MTLTRAKQLRTSVWPQKYKWKCNINSCLVHLDLREEARLVVDAVRVGPVDDAVAHVGVVQLQGCNSIDILGMSQNLSLLMLELGLRRHV